MVFIFPQDAPLTQLKISNGETLIVTEGQLPPKVFKSGTSGSTFVITLSELYPSLTFLLCVFFFPVRVFSSCLSGCIRMSETSRQRATRITLTVGAARSKRWRL